MNTLLSMNRKIELMFIQVINQKTEMSQNNTEPQHVPVTLRQIFLQRIIYLKDVFKTHPHTVFLHGTVFCHFA